MHGTFYKVFNYLFISSGTLLCFMGLSNKVKPFIQDTITYCSLLALYLGQTFVFREKILIVFL